MSNPDSKSLHIELIFYNQGQAVATRFYNESNINNLFAGTKCQFFITLYFLEQNYNYCSLKQTFFVAS